jgi:hypothetical protein
MEDTIQPFPAFTEIFHFALHELTQKASAPAGVA